MGPNTPEIVRILGILLNIIRYWATQKSIEAEHKRAMLACLLHYNLNVSLLMHFLGGNYVDAHRDVEKTVKLLR